MKRVKRSIAVILSLAIIMTGICWSEAPAKEVQAANGTEVNTEMLELKFQRGQGSISDKIRVVASVDSPNYSAVGFGIDKGDGEQIYTINTKTHPLPQRIKSSVTGLEYSFSPKVVDTSSEYFLTAKWTADENTKYTVRAWVKTFNDEMVFGQSRCITLADLSATNYLNMSFELDEDFELPKSTEDETRYADIAVTYNNGKSTTAEVISVKDNTVHVNVKNVNRTELPSVTEFVFGEYGSSTFRNLYTAYTETTVDEVTTDTADTSWYNTTDNEFVIATSADLYGLAKIVNGTATDITADAFANKTVYVVSDIAVNKEQTITIAANNTATVAGNDFGWTPIGKTKAFAGTFDGNMHKISGIYAVSSEANLGLFAATAEKSSIQNLKLENSYFDNSTNTTTEPHGLGSIVGTCKGNLVNVYSNAYVKSKHYSGGLVGEILTSSADPLNIQKCWFDGMIYATGSRHGGIVGRIAGGEIVMTDCLNTGSIDCNKQNLKGGLCGSVTNDSGYTVNLTMRNCLNDGLITDVKTSSAKTGAVVGETTGATGGTITVDIYNVYATDTSYEGSGYGSKKSTNATYTNMVITKVSAIDFDTWEFDTSLWTIDTETNKPALIMTMPAPQ